MSTDLFHQQKQALPSTFGQYGKDHLALLKKELGLAIKSITQNLGVKEYPADPFFATLMNLLPKYYQDFGIKNIVEAFELLMVQELDPFLPKDKHGQPERNHYQDFSVDYFLKVLNAYRKRVASRTPAKALLPEKPVSQEEKIILAWNFFDDLVKWADNEKMQKPFGGIGIGSEHTYALFVKWGLVPADIELPEPMLRVDRNEKKDDLLSRNSRPFAIRAKHIQQAIEKLHNEGKTLKSIILQYEYNDSPGGQAASPGL